MVNWKYVRVCVVTLSIQVARIIASPVVFGLVAYGGAVVGSGLLAIGALLALAPSDMPKVFKAYLLVQILVSIHVVLINLRWILVALGKWIAIQASIIVLLEFIADEIIALKHSFDEPPAIGWMFKHWEMMAVARSSNNGYGSRQFRGAIVCDTSTNGNDPFAPEHTSFVHLVEFRRHNVFWKEIIVWQLSLLSGVQKRLSEPGAHIEVIDAPFLRRYAAYDHSSCYESRGVIFVIFRPSVDSQDALYVYDTLNGKSATFKSLGIRDARRYVSITCQERLIGSNGEWNGWRIRLVVAYVDETHDFAQNQQQLLFRPSLAKYDMEFLVSQDHPIFVRLAIAALASTDNKPSAMVVRTSDGMLGICAQNVDGDGPVLLYDQCFDNFVYFANLEELCRSDKPFAAYFQYQALGHVYKGLCPTVLNDRECILTSDDGSIARMEFTPATARYTATKRIFRGDPSLKSRTSADEFRQLTGIHRMGVHFES